MPDDTLRTWEDKLILWLKTVPPEIRAEVLHRAFYCFDDWSKTPEGVKFWSRLAEATHKDYVGEPHESD